MRTNLKRAAEFGFVSFGVARFARARHARQTLVLAYHNIVPTGEHALGDSSLHLPQREFARQLDLLKHTHEVISMRELRMPATKGKPRAIITFDDAYAGAVDAGVAELARRGLPATIFVTPSFIGGASFWWDRFARPGAPGLNADVRKHALGALAGKDEAVNAWAKIAGLPESEVPGHQRGATQAALEMASATGLITFGSHTWSHPNLARLSVNELTSELMRPKEWLDSLFSNTVPFLAYPYGFYNVESASIARRCGYEGAFRIDGGWITDKKLATAQYELPRWNVPAGISLRGFEIRTSGGL